MAESPPLHDPLLARGLGAFHAAAFFVPLILLIHHVGDLTGFLEGIGTARGLLLYGALLGYSWLAARETLRDVVLEPPLTGRDARRALPRVVFWGGATGALSVVTAGLIIVLPASTAAAFAVLLFLSFASMAAFLIGAIVALILALLDFALYRLARRILRRRVTAA